MSCTDLGFDDYGNLRVSKSTDTEETGTLPPGYDLTGYTSALVVRETAGAVTAPLTVTTTINGVGSVITCGSTTITLLIKKADIAALPDADDPDEAWVGVYEWTLTDPDGLVTRFVSGSIIVEKGVAR